MKYQEIKNDGAKNLLLFFTGWGTTPEVVAHLQLPENFDYYAFWDYRTIHPSQLPTFSQEYEQVFLVAWSMGVWATDLLAPHLPVTKAIAVNGTPLPMHDLYGIPSEIFRGTLNGLDDDNRARFNRRMCGGKKLLAVYNTFSARSTEDLKCELLGVYEQVKDLPSDLPPSLSWSAAIVSGKDLIVPATNQLRYWEKHNINTHTLTSVGHYPFLEYSTWQELLSYE